VSNTGHPLLRSVHIVNRLFPQRGLGIVFFHFVISYLLTNDSLYPETDLNIALPKNQTNSLSYLFFRTLVSGEKTPDTSEDGH